MIRKRCQLEEDFAKELLKLADQELASMQKGETTSNLFSGSSKSTDSMPIFQRVFAGIAESTRKQARLMLANSSKIMYETPKFRASFTDGISWVQV